MNYSNLVTSYEAKGQYNEAEKLLNKAEEIYPELVKTQRVYLYILSDQLNKAEEEMGMQPSSINAGDKEIMRAMILFRRGKKSEGVQLLKSSIEPGRMGSFYVARAFAFMDQRDEAFYWLEKAYSERFRIVSVKYSPFLAPIRNDPRYVALLKKMNLPTD